MCDEIGKTLETPIAKKRGLVRKNGLFIKAFIVQCLSARHGIKKSIPRTLRPISRLSLKIDRKSLSIQT